MANNQHGHTYRTGTRVAVSPEYHSWMAMKARCYNPNRRSYRWYGARGIRVVERWHVFANFLADMGPRPEGHSLDRIDYDGDYGPDNCRWATREEQRANQRRGNQYTSIA